MPNYYITDLPKTATVAYYYPETNESLVEQITRENEIRLMDKLRGNYPNVLTLFNHNRSGTMRLLRWCSALNETHTKISPSHMSGVSCKHVSYEIDFDKLGELNRKVNSLGIREAERMIDAKEGTRDSRLLTWADFK